MNRKNIIPLSLAAASFACLTLPSSAEAGDPSTKHRPFAGTCSTYLAAFDQQAGTSTVETVCHLTHLGLATGYAEQQIVGGVPPVFQFINSNVYTAANGDELYVTFAGTVTFNADNTIAYEGTQTYSGGTGRFQNATGESALQGTASLVTKLGTFIETGWIAY